MSSPTPPFEYEPEISTVTGNVIGEAPINSELLLTKPSLIITQHRIDVGYVDASRLGKVKKYESIFKTMFEPCESFDPDIEVDEPFDPTDFDYIPEVPAFEIAIEDAKYAYNQDCFSYFDGDRLSFYLDDAVNTTAVSPEFGQSYKYHRLLDKLNHVIKHRNVEGAFCDSNHKEKILLDLIHRCFYKPAANFRTDGYNVFKPLECMSNENYSDKVMHIYHKIMKEVKSYKRITHKSYPQKPADLLEFRRCGDTKPIETMMKGMHRFRGFGLYKQQDRSKVVTSDWIAYQAETYVETGDKVETTNEPECYLVHQEPNFVVAFYDILRFIPVTFTCGFVTIMRTIHVKDFDNMEVRTLVISGAVNLIMYMTLGSKYGRLLVNSRFFRSVCSGVAILLDTLMTSDKSMPALRCAYGYPMLGVVHNLIWMVISRYEEVLRTSILDKPPKLCCVPEHTFYRKMLKHEMDTPDAWVRAFLIGNIITRHMMYAEEHGVIIKGKFRIDVHRSAIEAAEQWSHILLDATFDELLTIHTSRRGEFNISDKMDCWIYNKKLTIYAPAPNFGPTGDLRCDLCKLPNTSRYPVIHCLEKVEAMNVTPDDKIPTRNEPENIPSPEVSAADTDDE